MNIALGALIILLLLLPALFFRLGVSSISYNTEDKSSFSSELAGRNFLNLLSKLNFSETLFFFSIVPLILHLFSICLLNFVGLEIDYKQMLNVFSSQKDIIKDNTLFNFELKGFLLYVIIQTIAGFLFGLGVSKIFARNPRLYSILIGENFYIKLFSGLLLEQSKRPMVDLILVDVVCETKETTVIYSGFLEKFDIVSDKNELAYITLSGARRRDFRKFNKVEEFPGVPPAPNIKHSSYENESGDMLIIPGKYFTITGNRIANVNVTYMQLQNTVVGGVQHQTMVAVI